MGPFLTNSFVIKLSLGKGARLNSQQQLCVPHELLSRTLDLINHQGAGVQDISVQGARSTQAPTAQTPPAAAPTEKQPRVAGTRLRRSRGS
jgi:hypothetical protein